MTRRDEIAAGLAETEQRITEACDAAGRSRDEITLIVVTKTLPSQRRRPPRRAGRHWTSGRTATPRPATRPTEVAAPLRWHFLGGLQTNKAGAVARYADMVHSVDRIKLVNSLSRGAEAAGRTLPA